MHLPFSHHNDEPTMLTAFQAPAETGEETTESDLMPLYIGTVVTAASLFGVGVGVSTETAMGDLLMGIGAGIGAAAMKIRAVMHSEEQ